ncbi:MAG: histidine--tRNA ligase [Candidatus Altiarchaeales archaeon]|nr:histidine--tRNA ligase [Candidatus Altiarchaeales archaeon]
MRFIRPKGTRDFTADQVSERFQVLSVLRATSACWGYNEIMTPAFEGLDLFLAKSGEEIRSHLYEFSDKGGRRICLRPEATAQVARFYCQTLRSLPKPQRYVYFGPMYRYEEPQKNRYREFYQFGAELLGVKSPAADAEVLALACDCLNSLGLEYELRVSNLAFIRGYLKSEGLDVKSQDKVIHLLDKDEFEGLWELISEDKFKQILDCKSCEGDFEGKVGDAAKLCGVGCELAGGFSETLSILRENEVDFTLDFSMARGLDYYTGLVFDVKVGGLGAQNQVAGGGRYDKLIELFGGPSTPAIGFAFGFDRLVDALRLQGHEFMEPETDVVVVGMKGCASYGFSVAQLLRDALDFVVEQEISGRGVGKTLSHASDAGVKYAVILGQTEFDNRSVTVKDLGRGVQETVSLDGLVDWFFERI